MTRNPVGDNELFSATYWSAITNAHAREAVRSGCTPSKGTGDWDVDVASGDVVLTQRVPVAAQTVTVSDASALASGETRVDLVTVDATGTASVTAGTAASDPAAPDIPASEALLCAVVVQNGDTALTSSSIKDYRTLVDQDVDPLYGDGSDGSITRSANGNENGLVYATDYVVDAGVTRTVSNGVLVIHATERIEINGTLTASGQAGSGGAGGAGGSGGGTAGDGASGGSGDFIISGGSGGGTTAGGAGNDGGPGGGGGGGDSQGDDGGQGVGGAAGGGTGYSSNQLRQLRQFLTSAYDSIYDLSLIGGDGGGGGGGGAENDSNSSNGDSGGDGGGGGGVIVLVAPSIEVTGTVDASGVDGQNGLSDGGSDGGGGGGGGGGAGGGVILVGDAVDTSSGTATAAGGAGGTGSKSGGKSGGNGGSGATGLELTLTV